MPLLSDLMRVVARHRRVVRRPRFAAVRMAPGARLVVALGERRDATLPGLAADRIGARPRLNPPGSGVVPTRHAVRCLDPTRLTPQAVHAGV